MTMQINEETVTAADKQKLGIDKAKSAVEDVIDSVNAANNAEDKADEVAVNPPPGAFPTWVKLPAGLEFPPGRRIQALRFKAEWTDVPRKGERQCILWPLSEADEKLAYQRTRGESAMSLNELAKQMVRVVDGQLVTWGDGTPSDLTQWWTEIGARCRTLIKNSYAKMHTLEAGDLAAFFTDCQAVRTAT
jgi:hypothetical protein